MDIKNTVKNIASSKIKMIIAAAILIIIIAVVAGLIVLGNMGKPLDKDSTENVSITIESGSGTASIAQTLTDNGIIDNPSQFRFWSRIKGFDSQYKAGSYMLSPSMSFSEIADVLVGGKVEQVKFTIPEGYTIYQVADTLSEAGLVDRDKFVDLLENGDFTDEFEFLKGAQDNSNRLEGYLFPNTYFMDKGASEEDYIRVMLNQFQTQFTEEHYKKAEEMGLTLNEVVTIASIIQRECDAEKEGDKVASVIYNRLELGMPLQMCSTVQYLLGEPKPILSIADTQIQSPYNTYLNTGLPPGPICSPGMAAIDAALNPADTDYLYFVLSEKLDGTANFSNNYDDFLKDTQAFSEAWEAANG